MQQSKDNLLHLLDMIKDLHERVHLLYMTNIKLIASLRENDLLTHEERVALLDMQLKPKEYIHGESKRTRSAN
jgi:hypothetical protein